MFPGPSWPFSLCPQTQLMALVFLSEKWGQSTFWVTGLILNTLEIQGPFFLIEDTADQVGL